MAFIRFVQWALLLCFLSSGSLTSATFCEYNGDCYPPQTCCSDHVCREECHYCSYDSECGSRECCGNDGKCKTRCSDSICECPDGVSCREMYATIARRITNAELEDAVPRMVNVRHNVLMASVEKVVLARPTTTAEVSSAATQKVYAR